jgi:DNA-binding NarL/FixJ family response regulator
MCNENVDHITEALRPLDSSILLIRSEFLRTASPDRRPQVLPNVSVVVIGEDDAGASAEWIRTGCRGVLRPDVKPNLFCRAMESILAGELWAPRMVLSGLIQDLLLPQTFPELTSRQNAVLRLVRMGHTNQQIADRLEITRETVRWYLREMRNKVGGQVRKAGSPLAGGSNAHRFPKILQDVR